MVWGKPAKRRRLNELQYNVEAFGSGIRQQFEVVVNALTLILAVLS